MKKISNILWGVLLVIIGVIIALKSFDVVKFDIFFDGWWTLFIIVPCVIGLFSDDDKVGNVAGIIIGVLLLLGCRDIIDFSLIWKLLIPVIVIAIGLKLVLFGIFCKREGVEKSVTTDSQNRKNAIAVFAGNDLDFGGEVFSGAKFTAVFGGIECDLRNAIFEGDCVINAISVFGGVDILLPEGVNVKINSNSFFGGVSQENKNKKEGFEHTLYLNAVCAFGGVEVK